MLNAFKKSVLPLTINVAKKMGLGGVKPTQEKADELQALIKMSREERGAMKLMLTQIKIDSKNLSEAGKSIQKEKVVLDQLRDDLRQAQDETKDSADKRVALKGDFDKLWAIGSQLQQEYGRMKESLRATREEASNTTEAVRDVEKKLRPLVKLNELSETTEERLAMLNSLAEHVMQKVKVLENQKHTVEHAVVESNRVSEMVWNMDVQIGKLNEGSKQAAQADETLSRIEHVSRAVMAKLEQAQKTKEAFFGDLTKLEKGRVELCEFVKGHFEHLALDRKEFESFEQRVQTLQSELGALESGFDDLAAKEEGVAAMGQKAADLSEKLTKLFERTEKLQERQDGLATLDSQLAQTEELGAQVTRQHETLVQGRKEVDTLRKELDELYKTQTEIAKVREQIGADRRAFEAFLQRVNEFRHFIPDLDSRMDAIRDKLSVVDEGTQKAATLVAMTDDLDNQMMRIAAHQQLVEKIDTRVNSLNVFSVSVDKRLEEQITRRNEVEALKHQCDVLGVQVGDAQQKLQAVSGLQHKLLPLTTQVATIKTQIDQATAAFKEAHRDETELAAQAKRFAELADRSRDVATTVDERLKQIQSASEELGRASTVKEELAQELGRFQARQREVGAHVKASEDQIKRIGQQLKQLDQRHSKLSFAERKIAAFEE